MAIETNIYKTKFHNQSDVSFAVHETEHLTIRAKICLELIQRWGLIAGEDGGEDSTGRAKIKTQDPSKVVARAIAITQEFFVQTHSRGWIHELPSMEDARNQAISVTEKGAENAISDAMNEFSDD